MLNQLELMYADADPSERPTALLAAHAEQPQDPSPRPEPVHGFGSLTVLASLGFSPADLDPSPRLRCPTARRHLGDILGCGSTNLSGPDAEGLIDCADCGMWFSPAEAERVR